MDGGPTEGVGVVEVPTKDFPSIQAVHSQDAMVADLLQQAAEAGGVVEGQAGVVLEQGNHWSHDSKTFAFMSLHVHLRRM